MIYNQLVTWTAFAILAMVGNKRTDNTNVNANDSRYDMCGWHADTHPKLGRNPPVASISLGEIKLSCSED